jgi:hypothetical protein
VSSLYKNLRSMAAGVISFGGAYALGFDSFDTLPGVALMLFMPVYFLLGRLVPPKPKPYYPDYLSLDFLHGAPGQKNERTEVKPPEVP